MSGAHFPQYIGHRYGDPSISGVLLEQVPPIFYFYTWILFHVSASLIVIPYFKIASFASSDHRKDLFFLHLLLSLDAIAILAVAISIFRSFSTKTRILEHQISFLRACLESGTADAAASQSRYQLRASATAQNPRENPEHQNSNESNIETHSNAGENQILMIPSKVVAHADPNWMSDLQAEPSQRHSCNLKEEEAGQSSTTELLTAARDDLQGNSAVAAKLRPSWVEDGTLCVVCHNPFGPEGAHMLGTCGHIFHPPCLVDYSRVKRHCFCDVPIDERYYSSVCLRESMPPQWRDAHGRSVLHGDYSWGITIHT